MGVRYIELPISRGVAARETAGAFIGVPIIVKSWVRFDRIQELKPDEFKNSTLVTLIGSAEPLRVAITIDEIWRRVRDEYREV